MAIEEEILKKIKKLCSFQLNVPHLEISAEGRKGLMKKKPWGTKRGVEKECPLFRTLGEGRAKEGFASRSAPDA